MGKTRHFELFAVILLLMASLSTTAQTAREIYVTVESSKSARIDGLTKEHFRLFENGQQQEIVDVGTEAEPASIGILFDVSRSVLDWGLKDLNSAIKGLDKMVEEGSSSNEYFLMSFDKEISLLQDWTSQPDKFRDGLQMLSVSASKTAGSTSLHDACLTALKRLESAKHRKRALILFSDGHDSSLKPHKKDVVDALRKSSAIIFFVTVLEGERYSVFGSAGPQQSRPAGSAFVDLPGSEFINEITGLSGGRAYAVISTKPASKWLQSDGFPLIEDVFIRVQNDLASQYRLRYLSSKSGPDKTFRDIDVKVAIPKELRKGQGFVKVRFRRKYEEP